MPKLRSVAFLSVLAMTTSLLATQTVLAADAVTFVTDFGFNGRHAYYYVALDKGYYKEAGMDVKIVRGQGSTDAVKQVASGTAQFGFADTSAVIFAKANDGIPIKLVSVIYAKPPHAIYVLKDSGISKPKDLEGRKLADTAFSAMPKMFGAYAKAAGIDASKVTWVVAGSDALPGMLALGRVDGIGQYTVGEPLLKKAAAPKDIVALTYSDAGLDYYGSGIVTMESTLQSNPDLVKRFIAATLRGLKDAIANPQQAGEIMHKYHREVDEGVARDETIKVGQLATVPGAPMGSIDEARLQRTIDVVAGAYTLKSTVKPADIYAPNMVPK
ncbi:MAG TPA: ABC transporter substrate-binding protein [Pseudolabrys sp.]|nr:ABC transporter substrate-binding protein [Pseudolabrys sp.]